MAGEGCLARGKRWARIVKRDVVALWIAAGDARTPRRAKAVAGLVAAYALSPIDLIPDFIPVLGYLDDVVLLPLGVLLAVRMIPEPLMAEFRERAAERVGRPTSRSGMIAIALIWIAALVLVVGWVFGAPRAAP
jgi:uncharacterized membrane protein YkvA (DUF1232 family)